MYSEKDIINDELFYNKAYINGDWVDHEEKMDVINPSNKIKIGEVPQMGTYHTVLAIDAAKSAFDMWKGLLAKERSAIMLKWYSLIMENIDKLATILSYEQGKPFAEAKAECTYGAAFIQWYAEEGKRVYGETIPPFRPNSKIIVNKEAIGVVTAITPWNFPNAMITRKISPALAVGCTVVVKPSELTPFSAIALMKLAEKAGFPKGVINLVIGNAEKIGKEFCENEDVKKITFTGSTRVGKILLEQSASSVKKVSLELGGNAPCIIFDDADLRLALQGTMASKFRNSGQTCVCANRIFVHNKVYDQFTEMLVNETSKLVPGTPFEPLSTQGPLINEAAVKKVKDHISDAVAKGAKIKLGGKSDEKGGTFFQPTILTEMQDGSLMSSEETFGPVAGIYRFETEEEVIKKANDTIYGLAAYFFTKDLGRTFRVSSQLEYGIIGVNEGIISTEVAPFGGVKQSGLGREGSKHGLEDFLEIKYIMVGGLGNETAC